MRDFDAKLGTRNDGTTAISHFRIVTRNRRNQLEFGEINKLRIMKKRGYK